MNNGVNCGVRSKLRAILKYISMVCVDAEYIHMVKEIGIHFIVMPPASVILRMVQFSM
jgi:hypothetical protein